MKNNQHFVNASIQQFREEQMRLLDDQLCTEEPLEFRVPFLNDKGETSYQTLAITMRTPGHDIELATGFLYSEGIITSAKDIGGFRYCDERGEAGYRNSLEVQLLNPLPSASHHLERRFTTYSSCGLCGKTSIQSLELQNPPDLNQKKELFDMQLLKPLSDTMQEQQQLFSLTGSAHASGLFDIDGNLLKVFEDVGRHNALDKLIGYYLKNNPELLRESILLVSGRASFELVQKAIMAAIPVLAAVGGPSSLAVETAKRFNLTLIGFLASNRFNIYNAPWRLKLH